MLTFQGFLQVGEQPPQPLQVEVVHLPIVEELRRDVGLCRQQEEDEEGESRGGRRGEIHLNIKLRAEITAIIISSSFYIKLFYIFECFYEITIYIYILKLFWELFMKNLVAILI